MLGVLGAAEAAIRLTGLSGFPLFAAHPDSYRMKAGQAGIFRRRNAWRYDRFGQRTDHVLDSLAGCAVLIGDSVVDGGNHVDQAETMAAQLAALTGRTVYPVGCHGWSLANELAVLRSLPDWREAERLIFVLNTGDFDAIGSAPSPLSFPTRYPPLFLPWLIARKLYRSPAFGRLIGRKPPIRFVPAVRAAILADFAATMAEYAGPVVLLRFPKIDEDPSLEPFYDELLAAAGPHRSRLIELAGRPDWGSDCYLDFIHPNRRGIGVAALAIAEGAFEERTS